MKNNLISCIILTIFMILSVLAQALLDVKAGGTYNVLCITILASMFGAIVYWFRFAKVAMREGLRW